ncbi:MAG: bile acid:sodium symporter family protein [Hydrogenovibrio sp.]|nr:bile acid:sodium symporter family protein [Hydrogenovibrio sp.]
MLTGLMRFFPLWVLLFAGYAYYQPFLFSGLKPAILPLLMLIMFGMGMTLSWQDFKRVYEQKGAVMAGVAIQFVVMPLAALGLSKLFQFSDALTIGMMLVGATAGGTASNVIVYLIRGNVALSVSMTFVSTLLAIFLLPFLTWLYLGQRVDVPVQSMLLSLLQLILLPVVTGMLFNQFFSRWTRPFQHVFPVFSMAAIVLIIAIVVALNHSNLQSLAGVLVLAVILHNLSGLAAGYWVSKLLGYDEKTARTVAVEVGMQNSGLSVALAIKYFSAASALPGALFSIWHNLSGSLLAAYWRDR